MNSNAPRDPFASTVIEPPQFAKKAKAARPTTDAATVEQIAIDNNFTSRQPPRVQVTRKQKRHTTGRNQHIPVKATAATAERFRLMAEQRGVTYGEMLEIALDALASRGE